MKINSLEAETNAVIRVAEDMAAAARTAPKTRGIDHIETLIVTGDDLKELADAMKRYGEQTGQAFFVRDSKNIENSKAVLFIASGHHVRGLNETCALCGAANCAEASKEKKNCVYDPIDLGIALGSAVSVAAAAHIDNRIMFSAGVGAKLVGWFDESLPMVFAIPLSTSGKSIYFDRG